MLLKQLALSTLMLFFLLACGNNSGETTSQYSAIDENSQEAYTILHGYLKRRGGAPQKAEMRVITSEAKLTFKWQQEEGTRYFSMEQREGAWLIQEISATP
ncbi:hypothetical protein SAMN02745866_03502 [Alteromonadaceae bacterium Bs31]|nr:hypothetical protein SAMN02745866_03502 [Alteromonadaceae bacterium Bs31]